jgi:transposase
MEIKNIACLLFNNLLEQNIKKNNNIKIICNLFKITKSTFYRWNNEYKVIKNNINNNKNIENNIIIDFKSKIITKSIVYFIISYILSNFYINYKKIKKQLNENFPDNKISFKHIHLIIKANENNILNKINCNKKNYKLTKQIEQFICDNINNNNCLTANNISNLIYDKFKLKISLTTIYNFLHKKNYVYKKTVINVNPYSYEDQKEHLTNVYYFLNNNNNYNNNNNNNNLIFTNNTFKKNIQNDINKMNCLLEQEIKIIKNNDIYDSNSFINELISIDEMSIITNRACTKGWALKNKECIINIPYLKPNERYSLLMATSKNKIIKYLLVKKSIKTDDFIKFMNELNIDNPNSTYLIDNASIHKNKKTNDFYKKNKLHIVYNAPYQSKFNPIEMVFSLLRKKLNKKIVKTNEEIKQVIELFIIEIKKEELENIFNHSIKILKEYLKI